MIPAALTKGLTSACVIIVTLSIGVTRRECRWLAEYFAERARGLEAKKSRR